MSRRLKANGHLYRKLCRIVVFMLRHIRNIHVQNRFAEPRLSKQTQQHGAQQHEAQQHQSQQFHCQGTCSSLKKVFDHQDELNLHMMYYHGRPQQ